MALVCSLKRGGSTLVDFQGGTSGFQLINEGWIPRVSRLVNGVAQPVAETLPVQVTGSSHDNLATYLQALAEAQYWADQYQHSRLVEDPVWFHAKLNNETGERRALVYAIEWAFDTSYFDAQAIDNKAFLTLTIEHDVWERTAARSFPAGTIGPSELYDYTSGHDVVGDIAARIDRIQVRYSAGELDKIWMGIRSDGKCVAGDAANFVTIWECEDGTNNSNESGISDDTTSETNTASPGSGSGAYVEVTESDLDWDDTWHEALELTVDDVAKGNPGDQFGTNLWLLRAKVTAGTWEVKLKFGYEDMDADDFVTLGAVEMDETDWTLCEMGVQQVPFRPIQTADLSYIIAAMEATFALQIWARRTSGSGDLYLDCLYPVPVDEGYLKIWNIGELSASDDLVHVLQSPLGEWWVASKEDSVGAFVNVDPFIVQGFAFPPGDARLVVVVSGNPSTLSDALVFNTSSRYYERWLSLRGAE